MNRKSVESSLLHLIQESVPFVAAPFADIAGRCGITESEAINVINRFKESGIIRNISGIFNGESLGYSMSLAALKVSSPYVEKAAGIINSLPGVSHNYLRENDYNIWFTIALEPGVSLDETVKVIAEESGADDYLVLRNERLLKVKAVFNMGGEDIDDEEDGETYLQNISSQMHRGKPRDFSAEEKNAICLLQKDLPLSQRPYVRLIEESGLDISEERFLEIADSLIAQGFMRRYAAVLRHVKAGYSSNAMVVWKFDGDDGKLMPFMINKNITHLYLRTVYPGRWEHNLFSMIHAKDDAMMKSIIGNLSERSGISDFMVLKSLKEFKKSRVIYFQSRF